MIISDRRSFLGSDSLLHRKRMINTPLSNGNNFSAPNIIGIAGDVLSVRFDGDSAIRSNLSNSWWKSFTGLPSCLLDLCLLCGWIASHIPIQIRLGTKNKRNSRWYLSHHFQSAFLPSLLIETFELPGTLEIPTNCCRRHRRCCYCCCAVSSLHHLRVIIDSLFNYMKTKYRK